MCVNPPEAVISRIHEFPAVRRPDHIRRTFIFPVRDAPGFSTPKLTNVKLRDACFDSYEGKARSIGRSVEAPVAIAAVGMSDAAALAAVQEYLENRVRLIRFAIPHENRISIGCP